MNKIDFIEVRTDDVIMMTHEFGYDMQWLVVDRKGANQAMKDAMVIPVNPAATIWIVKIEGHFNFKLHLFLLRS